MTPHEEAATADAHLVANHLVHAPALEGMPEQDQAVRDAYALAAEDFYRAGGTVTLREWCLMPEVIRAAFLKARDRLLEGLLK